MIYDVEDNARMNLGKEIIVKSGRRGMIVGYNLHLDSIIVSYTADVGFIRLTILNDIILLKSPLNTSYGYVSTTYAKRHLIE